jgi:hypothetical protein
LTGASTNGLLRPHQRRNPAPSGLLTNSTIASTGSNQGRITPKNSSSTDSIVVMLLVEADHASPKVSDPPIPILPL